MTRAYNDPRSFRTFGGRNSKPVFQCECCHRNTRITTQDSDEVCAECYELLGLQNSLFDDGADEFRKWGIAPRDALVAKIIRRKGDPDAVKRYAKRLFEV